MLPTVAAISPRDPRLLIVAAYCQSLGGEGELAIVRRFHKATKLDTSYSLLVIYYESNIGTRGASPANQFSIVKHKRSPTTVEKCTSRPEQGVLVLGALCALLMAATRP